MAEKSNDLSGPCSSEVHRQIQVIQYFRGISILYKESRCIYKGIGRVVFLATSYCYCFECLSHYFAWKTEKTFKSPQFVFSRRRSLSYMWNFCGSDRFVYLGNVKVNDQGQGNEVSDINLFPQIVGFFESLRAYKK